jgi:hypothetical protein
MLPIIFGYMVFVYRSVGGEGGRLRRYHGGDRRTDMGVVSIIP